MYTNRTTDHKPVAGAVALVAILLPILLVVASLIAVPLYYISSLIIHWSITQYQPFLPDWLPIPTPQQLFALLCVASVIRLPFRQTESHDESRVDTRSVGRKIGVAVLTQVSLWAGVWMTTNISIWILNNWF